MDTQISADNMIGTCFSWVWDIEQNTFCSDTLVPLLFEDNIGNSVRFKQLIDRLNEYQAVHFKNHIELALKQKIEIQCHLIFNIQHCKYLAKVTISTANLSKVSGHICLIKNLLAQEQEKKLLNEIFHNSSKLVIICDKNLDVIITNTQINQSLGFNDYEILGHRISKIICNNHNTFDEINLRCKQKKPWSGEIILYDKEKQERPFKAMLSTFHDKVKNEYLYIFQLTAMDFSFNQIEYLGKDNDQWSWQNKVDFFQQIDSCREQLDDSESMIVFMLNTFVAGVKNSKKSLWLISHSFYHNDFNKARYKIGLLNQNQICGIIISSKIVKNIHKDLCKIIYKLVKNELNENDNILCHVGVSIDGADAKNNTQLLGHAAQSLISTNDKCINFQGHKINYFDPRVNEINDRKAKIEQALKHSLSTKNINVAYQPIVEIKSLSVKRIEALARFKLAVPFDYTTQEVIEIAEENDWINEVDTLVAEIALKEIDPLSQLLDNQNLSLSINRSMVSTYSNRSNLEDTLSLFKKTNIDLSRITLELTESSIFANDPRVVETIHNIQKAGLTIAIDDFGSGYTSFTNLTKLPMSLIKIDKDIIFGIDKDQHRQLMVKMFTQLIHSLGGKIIAEGVETVKDFMVLQKVGVDYIQGYFFSKPKLLIDHQGTINSINGVVKKYQLTEQVEGNQVHNISSLFVPNLVHIHPDDRVEELMPQLQKSAFLVVFKKNKCIGLVTQDDVNNAISPYINTDAETSHDRLTLSKRAHQIMQTVEYTCETSFSVCDIISHFCEHPNSLMVVTGKTGMLLGVINFEQVKPLIKTYLPLNN
ncbi:EAL domain-containing protein [Shewanella intestini]|uniref:EAL domain-containing protein n=1 Tax=Shewanella intestini TaxID=2017544 RepID=A0ABS5HYU1_9GAMM|nr:MULTISPECIES: EAL domain-containing protein [Shewanella]MBR9726962.1 EAL domain-containing protein [Shewanella intestini]MRG34472.1 EAL domain-containing protein [Shewanella sp. XMDDZSB0408]